MHLRYVQGDSVDRDPKFYKDRIILKKSLATQTILSIDYEQVLLCIVSGMCI
jgi:hypothetical protein